MNKQEAIEKAKNELLRSGITQFILRRRDKYMVVPANVIPPSGWKTAEMITKGNLHAY